PYRFTSTSSNDSDTRWSRSAGVRWCCTRLRTLTQGLTRWHRSASWLRISHAVVSGAGPIDWSDSHRPGLVVQQSRRASDSTRPRGGNFCRGCSVAPCRPTMCTAGRPSFNCRVRNWSAALGDDRTLILIGPTGVGKTAVALALAEHWPVEVI